MGLFFSFRESLGREKIHLLACVETAYCCTRVQLSFHKVPLVPKAVPKPHTHTHTAKQAQTLTEATWAVKPQSIFSAYTLIPMWPISIHVIYSISTNISLSGSNKLMQSVYWSSPSSDLADPSSLYSHVHLTVSFWVKVVSGVILCVWRVF